MKQNLDQTFGPILWTQYTLHRGTMKMTAQVSPMGKMNKEKAHLELFKGEVEEGTKLSNSVFASTAHFELKTGTIIKKYLTGLSFWTEIQSENGRESFVKTRKTKAQSSLLRCHA